MLTMRSFASAADKIASRLGALSADVLDVHEVQAEGGEFFSARHHCEAGYCR